MNFNKFTIKSQEAVQNAQEIASSYGNQTIEPEHLLAALVQDSQGIVIPILQKLGANVNYVKIKINEVVEGKKISYSWQYDGFEGSSFVTFELFAQGNKTKFILTHRGLNTFPGDNPDFSYHNYAEGWTYIIGTSLKEFVEKKNG